MNIRTYLSHHDLLFDGAMGTYYANSKGRHAIVEKANISAPQEIMAIHREYLDAGANAIKTNTFSVNRTNFSEGTCRDLIRAGWELAGFAISTREAFAFADIGPIEKSTNIDPAVEFRFVADCFLEAGAQNFLFETNGTALGLAEAASYIKSRNPDAFIIVSFASLPDGFTASGYRISQLFQEMIDCDAVDAIGLNCVTGAHHMIKLVESLGKISKPLSIMPNAGYPHVTNMRTVYGGSPFYFAQEMCSLLSLGVHILGGCCGTTPEFIAATAEALKNPTATVSYSSGQAVIRHASRPESPFWQALCDPRQKPFAVELDPPDAAETEKYIAGVQELHEAGASIVTIADCPVARAKMDSSLLACKVTRELHMETLPHMTCRDRNLNATKALLLGLNAEGIQNVLIITGDPIPTVNRDKVKSVFNFNSRVLANYIVGLNETVLPTPFHIFGALNINATNFDNQLKIAQEKIKNGMSGFLTQPVLSENAIENLKKAHETLNAKILGGIFPVVSYRNAMYMQSEVSGIRIDPDIIEMYKDADREEGENLAEDISAAFAERIAPYVDGYYLMTPFSRTSLVSRIMQRIRESESF